MTLPEVVYIPDTNIWSAAGLKDPPQRLVGWMRHVGIDRLALVFPVIAELRRGAHLAEEANAAKSSRLFAWIETLEQTGFIEIEVSREVVDIYAKLTSIKALKHLWSADPRRKNCSLGHDLMIAAFSIAYGMPIATRNGRDFAAIHDHCPLPGLYDPFDDKWLLECQGASNMRPLSGTCGLFTR